MPEHVHTHCGKRMLDEYEAPPLDAAADEALSDFITRKKASMPDANY